MYLAGPREVCVCITYWREAWIEGPARGGGVGEIAREMREVYRERDEYDVKVRDPLECVYARGEGIETRGEFFWVVYVLVCVGVRR